jgi:NAD-dependent protein deacetylases, SIR2 family
MNSEVERDIERAARAIRSSHSILAFTGAGISVESGVPTFRGEGGLWEKVDQSLLQIDRFEAEPLTSWTAIRELFYASAIGGRRPEPNAAHRVLAKWEAEGRVALVVTQNIDGLHSAAGSRRVVEFHGSVRDLVCRRCGARVAASEEALAAGLLATLPPRCSAPGRGGRPCGGLLKPDFVFFGEGIPSEAYSAAFDAASRADLCLIVGSTGVVYPAAGVPVAAKRSGACIVEVDPGETEFSASISDIHIRLGASEALERIDSIL